MLVTIVMTILVFILFMFFVMMFNVYFDYILSIAIHIVPTLMYMGRVVDMV